MNTELRHFFTNIIQSSSTIIVIGQKNQIPRISTHSKGQLISKCLSEVVVWTKIATKIFPGFLFLKFI